MGRMLVEREHELAELAAAIAEAKGGQGSIVLIVGEAGIGKSRLVQSLGSVVPEETRLLIGYCDDLATPRVLGPLRDLVGSVGEALTQSLEAADRARVHDALRIELDWPQRPTVLVVEDAHWADEATLDVLSFIVRRITDLAAVLVLTYRDDDVTRDHPLRRLLGRASSAARVRWLRLQPLSPDGVRRLGADSSLDPAQVYAVTSGNPLFVTEVIASGDVGGVPSTIAEAVGARLAALDASSRQALEGLAVIPSSVERWLVDAVVPGGITSLAPAEQHGILTVTPSRVTFRHELMRRAIVDSMTMVRRVAHNHAVLAALLDRADGVDPSRIVHHAVESGDDSALTRYGPMAARDAAAAGSHREAVAHYRLVVEHRDAYPPDQQADLLQEYAVECYTVGLADAAVQAQESAVRLYRELGDPRALGIGLRWLSRISWWSGERRPAEAAAAEATAILEDAGDDSALAFALSNQSQLYVLAGRNAESIVVGDRAVTMARENGDAGLLSHALTNVGWARWDLGQADGRPMLDEALAVALAGNEIEHACRTWVVIAWHVLERLELDEAAELMQTALERAEQAEVLGFQQYISVSRSMISLARGAWDDARREAEWAVDAPAIMRCPALAVLGRIRARSGRGDARALLTPALAIAQNLGEAQRLGPVASGLLEAAYLRDEPVDVDSAISEAYDEVYRYGTPGLAAEFGYWMRACGEPVEIRESSHPYALLARGEWREAADQWHRAGYPYEHAAALAHSSDPDDLLEALRVLDALAAEPLGRRVRQQLKELGIQRPRRGPALSTRDNPAGLTGRQNEVLALLVSGLTNAEIAARLVLSVRTVDTHVAAILEKLGASSRRDAAAKARARGLVPDR
jgi:DNA-binding CsgD family transcriptional regulator/tetratricopeptide (TPR) repeat protein/energy-coupling factor transporter ATP-binding protein EcfA2